MKIFNKKTLQKIAIISAATLSTAAMSTTAFASNSNNNNNNMQASSIVKAIQDLGNEIKALTFAGVKAVNNTMYQFDKNLPGIIQTNNAHSAVNTATSAQAYKTTENDLQDTMQQFPDAALTYNFKSPDVDAALQRIQKRNNIVNKLTIGTPASDTLYSDVQNVGGSSFFTGGYKVTKPTKIHDNYFNFDSLIVPKAYNQDEHTAASRFIEYLTKRYQPLGNKIDFNLLRATLNQYKNKPEQLGEMLNSFVTSKAYKQYQLSVRSLLASRSVALSNMNQLMVERTPIKTTQPNAGLASLSETIGVKPSVIYKKDPNNPSEKTKYYVYASPLQISNYIANHRANSKQWYQDMAKASPATVQRETLYVLAEMESQMQRQHIDSERLLATLTAMQLEASAGNALALQTKARAVNTEIKSLAGEQTDSKSSALSSS